MSERPHPLEHLARRARALPKVPGVYLMKDAQGRVIYVGKASVLPNRVASYFQPSADLGPKKQIMLEQICDFDIVECEGEWEALLTENRLIKDLHPRFNARLTDGKTYPYLAVTTQQDFPGVYITREPASEMFKGARILGPFTSVSALREAVKLMQRIFQFRTCEMEIREDDSSRRYFRPCLLHAIRQCTAPCADRVSAGTYRADIDRLLRFLESKRSVLLRQMRQEMLQASQNTEFEKAASLRDQITAIEKLSERGRTADAWQPETESLWTDPSKGLRSLRKTLGLDRDLRCLEAIDIAHLQGNQTVGAKVCFVDGRPLKNQYRRFRIRDAGNDDFASIREVILRAYRDAGAGQQLYPDLVLIDGGAGQLSSAIAAFATFQRRPPAVIALAKREELIHTPEKSEPIRLSRTNAGLRLCQAIRDEAHRFAQHYHHLLRRKNLLDESATPTGMESPSGNEPDDVTED